MTEVKTIQNDDSVLAFIDSVENNQRRQDAIELLDIFERATGGIKPALWGPSIVGYGKYHYKYDSGHEGDTALTGFSPRKQSMTIYITDGFGDYQAQLKNLGKHKTSVSCLYIKKLSDVDQKVLESIIRDSVEKIKATHQISG